MKSYFSICFFLKHDKHGSKKTDTSLSGLQRTSGFADNVQLMCPLAQFAAVSGAAVGIIYLESPKNSYNGMIMCYPTEQQYQFLWIS